jgi:hypothetical protein
MRNTAVFRALKKVVTSDSYSPAEDYKEYEVCNELWLPVSSYFRTVFGLSDHEQWISPLYLMGLTTTPDMAIFEMCAPTSAHAAVVTATFVAAMEIALSEFLGFECKMTCGSPESRRRLDAAITLTLNFNVFKIGKDLISAVMNYEPLALQRAG